MKIAITSKRLNYRYQIECADKGIVGVYGISGSGKSSLLDAIAGYHEDRLGIVEYNNKELKGIIKCCYMSQHPILFAHWTVEENLQFALTHASQNSKDKDQLVQRLGCEKLLKMYPNQLSGGEKQRIAFVRALLQIEENSLVLLDEPFSALDKKMRKIALDLLEQYKQSCLILLVTHEIAELYQVADALLYLKNSTVSYQNSIEMAMASGHDSLPVASTVTIDGQPRIVFAEDVSIALQKHPESSISYQLESDITALQTQTNVTLVKLSYSNEEQFIYARLMTDSIKKLNLFAGKKVFACFKCSNFMD